MPSTVQQIERRSRAFGKGAHLFYENPVKIVRGEGIYLFDDKGRRYLDLYNNVAAVGHCHPHVTEAVSRQIKTVNTHSRYLHDGAIELAERLAALHGPQIESVLFSCTGTEAIECALRMARMATGRSGFICSDWTYHGNSELVSTLTYLAANDRVKSDTVRTFAFPDMYRSIKEGLSENQLCDEYLGQIESAISALQQAGIGVAALIVCPIFANEGLPNIPHGFLERATTLVRQAGGIIISDEVQAGYARTGRWWGYETTEFTPDIVVTGKPMGNGIPLSATATSQDIMNTFRAKTRYFNTFSASPLQAAAGIAVLDVIESEELCEQAGRIGNALRERLAELTEDTPFVGDVRGKGLFLTVDIVQPGTKTPDMALALKIAERLKDLGALSATDGRHNNLIKLRPPLVFSDQNLEEFLHIWTRAMVGIDV
jgi:4-aminobutyrate aminotransferase-like enzyme